MTDEIVSRKERMKEASSRWYQNHKQEMHEQYLRNKQNPEWAERKKKTAHIYNTSPQYREKDRARSRTGERRQYLNKFMRTWRKTDKGRQNDIRCRNAPQRRIYLKQWRKTLKGVIAGKRNSNLRRIRQRNAGNRVSTADIELIVRLSIGRCWWCGKRIKGQYHIDHRIPLSKGGSNDAANLCISCPKCNLSKHDKMPSEWSDRLL